MDEIEARDLLLRELENHRTRSYDDLRLCIGSVGARTVVSSSGREYNLEIEVFWDGDSEGSLRVLGSIDDGSLRAVRPICEDLIVLRENCDDRSKPG